MIMTNLTINKWGNSSGVRLPKTILDALNVNIGEELQVTVHGTTVILEKAIQKNEELSFEQLFENYSGEKFESDIVLFESSGNEKW